jgi:hypothetical protein
VHIPFPVPSPCPILQLALTEARDGLSSPAVITAFSRPVWMTRTYPRSCRESCSGSGSSRSCRTTCSCDYGGRDNGDSSCSLWYRLSQVCIVVDVPPSQSLRTVTISNPSGCAQVDTRQVRESTRTNGVGVMLLPPAEPAPRAVECSWNEHVRCRRVQRVCIAADVWCHVPILPRCHRALECGSPRPGVCFACLRADCRGSRAPV